MYVLECHYGVTNTGLGPLKIWTLVWNKPKNLKGNFVIIYNIGCIVGNL